MSILNDRNQFQHSLVSLFWGHQGLLIRPDAPTIVSALSGESILGPLYGYSTSFSLSAMFQHSLVSLFWGHERTSILVSFKLVVSALSGESILGPP